MLSLSPTVRVFVAVAPISMRGSFDALAGAVRRLQLDPVDGHLYLFLNKRRHIAKALWFDGSGWCVLAKRLEAGTHMSPPPSTAPLPGGSVCSRLIAFHAASLRGRGGQKEELAAQGVSYPRALQRERAPEARVGLTVGSNASSGEVEWPFKIDEKRRNGPGSDVSEYSGRGA